MAHTPGPWVVTANRRERTIQIDTADGRGTVVQPGAISWAPDAALLAASPSLLHALERLVAFAAPYGIPLDDAEVAIRRAKGLE